MTDLPDALSPQTTQISTPKLDPEDLPWAKLGGDLCPPEVTWLSETEDISEGLGELVRLRAPLASSFRTESAVFRGGEFVLDLLGLALGLLLTKEGVMEMMGVLEEGRERRGLMLSTALLEEDRMAAAAETAATLES